MTVTSQAVSVLNQRFSHWRAEMSNRTCTVIPTSTAYRSMLAFISCRHTLCGLLSSVSRTNSRLFHSLPEVLPIPSLTGSTAMIFPRISIFINIGFLMVCLFSQTSGKLRQPAGGSAKRKGYTLTVLC